MLRSTLYGQFGGRTAGLAVIVGLAVSLVAPGCSQSSETFRDRLEKATGQKLPSPSDSAETTAGEESSPDPKGDGRGAEKGETGETKDGDQTDAKSGTDGESETDGKSETDAKDEKKSNLRVRTLRLRTEAAKRALQRNFDGFLDRRPLGFDASLVEKIRAESRRLARRARTLPRRIRASNPVEIVRLALPFLIIALFLSAYFVLSRHVGRLTHHIQAAMHFEFSRWATRILRALVLVAGRIATAAFLLIASYFPIRAIFGAVPWTDLLTRGLWYLLAYRAVSSVVVALFSGRILELEREHAQRLESLGVAGARIVTGFLYAIDGVQILGYPDDFAAVSTFALRVALITFPIYLYFARDAVLDLLPHEVDSKFYDLFRRTLQANYRLFMLGTAALFAFRAAGYVEASTFILVRGYALLGLVVGAFAFFANLSEFLEERVAGRLSDEPDETPLEGPDPRRLARRIEQLVGFGLVIGVSVLSLEILLLREPVLILLRIPFLAIGSAKISVVTLLNVALIVFGAVLATKLLRALLNSQIYPLFEVDVGVAYAVNTIIKYVLIVSAFFLGLTALGVDLTALTVVLASLGVGIGFGLQTIVENLISGFILLFGQSVQKGDYITVDDTYGQVEAVGARSVIIKTPDNFEMLVPSKEIVGGRIINWSYEDNAVRARLKVGVSYDSEPEEVRDVLLSTCDAHDDVLEEPAPSVRLAEFGDSSIDFELLFFFDCRDTTERKVIGELNFEVWEALEEAGITIPFPQRDLHVKSEEDWERLESLMERRRASDDGDAETPESDEESRESDDESSASD